MTSMAQEIYRGLGCEGNLLSFIDSEAPETLYLEFKSKRDTRNDVLHDDDKKNFSKSLSAFANSDGGVLVWGIKQSPRAVAG